MTVYTPPPPAAADGSMAHARSAPTIPTLTLRSLLGEVGRAVRQNAPREAWVDAAITRVVRRKAGYALELCEDDIGHDGKSPRLNAFLPHSNVATLRETLNMLDLDPAELAGMRAILRLAISFHQQYHLQATVCDINPVRTASLSAKHNDLIRGRLLADGLLDAQKSLAPSDVNRLIVIHPEGAAGWADVVSELGRYQAAGIAETIDISAAFEGKNAIGSLLGALRDVVEINKSRPIDLVMLVRGGGASSGLAMLANEDLARAICQLGIPVLTGIGHASDRTIIDEVSWQAADTPSKALALVASLIREPAARARKDMAEILRLSRRTIAAREAGLRETIAAARSLALRRFSEADGMLEKAHANLRVEIAIIQTDLGHAALALERLHGDLFAGAPDALCAQMSEATALLQGGASAAQTQLAALTDSLERPAQIGGVAIELINDQLSAVLALGDALAAHAGHRLGAEAAALAEYERGMRALSVQGTLERGFALAISSAAGAIVATAEAARALNHFELLFNDGRVAVRLEVATHIATNEGS